MSVNRVKLPSSAKIIITFGLFEKVDLGLPLDNAIIVIASEAIEIDTTIAGIDQLGLISLPASQLIRAEPLSCVYG